MLAALSLYQLYCNARLVSDMGGMKTLDVYFYMVYLMMAFAMDGAYDFITLY